MFFTGIKAGGTTQSARSKMFSLRRKTGGCLDGGKMRDTL